MTDAPTSYDAPAAAPQGPPSGVADLVAELRYVIESARTLPLSVSASINRDEVLALIDDIQASLPDELRSARWLLKEREEFRAKMKREGDEIVSLARNRAEHMVQRTQVVKAAEARARKVVEQAEAEARRLRLEAEDYCDQKLGSFENVLQRTLQQVGAGRAKLQGNLLDELSDAPQDEAMHPLDEPTQQHPAAHPEAQGY
ncbi:MAG: hypothetical protein AAF567_13005 [Actinomycetota bacterium]